MTGMPRYRFDRLDEDRLREQIDLSSDEAALAQAAGDDEFAAGARDVVRACQAELEHRANRERGAGLDEEAA